MNIYIKYLSAIFFIAFSLDLNAAHIVGGDVTYTCLQIDTTNQRSQFLFEFTIYRDTESNGADFDGPLNTRFGIYLQDINGVWNFIDEVTNVGFADRMPIEIIENPCILTPDNVGVESAVYRFNYWIDWETTNYMVSYQRCCRNNTIANIINPGEAGAAYTIELYPEAQRSCNNSPQFNEFPPIFVCNGLDINFDHSAFDADGDEIIYSFCAPQSSGGTDGSGPGGGDQNSCTGVRPAPDRCPPPYDEVVFRNPFFDQAPLAGDPVVTINSITGLISGNPNLNGQFVVGVCATEYRDGEIIGVIRRDFQFNVITCQQLVSADIASDLQVGDQEFFVNACGVTELKLINESTEEENIETYRWFFEIDGVIQESFQRDATFTFPGLGVYEGTMIINEDIDGCSDTANITVTLFPSMESEFDFSYDTCVAGPVTFVDQSFTNDPLGQVEDWSWDFNDGNTDFRQNPSHQFTSPGIQEVTLISEDSNGCADTITQEIEWFPAPPILLVEPDNFLGCVPADIFFNNLSSPIDTTYDINWDFGDGTTGTDISPTHSYEEPGIYSISLDVVSPIGCGISVNFPNWIRVEPAPIADFNFLPDEPTIFQSEVSFFDQSINAVRYQWDFGGVGTSTLQNPTFDFPDTGMYEVKLTVIHPSGCPDTITKLIDVQPISTFFLPNAFTPNNDGRNDLFLGKGITDGIREFEMAVWNRWGERVFYTQDPREGWNGRKDNFGQLSPQGVYVYTLRIIGPRGEISEANGNVTLIK